MLQDSATTTPKTYTPARMQELCTTLKHVALIIDGHRRWARNNGKTYKESYLIINDIVPKLTDVAFQHGLHTFTVWLLSDSNIAKRPEEELTLMYNTYIELCHILQPICKKHNTKVIITGDLSKVDSLLEKELNNLVEATKNNTKHFLNLSVNFSGHQEILSAVKRILQAGIKPEEVTYKTIEKYLDMSKLPHPKHDLIIRTGKAQRMSGYDNWYADFTEFFFSPVYFPDFTVEHFLDALHNYSEKKRTFGK